MAENVTAPAKSAPSVVPASQTVVKPTVVPASVAGDAEGTHDEPSTLTKNSIAEASKAFRAKPDTAPKTTPVAESAINVEAEPEAETDERPRNPDGTFAAAQPVEAEAEATDDEDVTEPDGEAVEGEATEADAETVEPKVFKLAGEPQRGEEDIELDVTGLPPEAVERLERLEKRGLRRKEYDTAMNRVSKLESDQMEVETLLRLNPEGFVLDHLSPATRVKVGAAILLEHWDEMAPDIEALWGDEAGRFRALTQIKNGVQTRSAGVQRQVEMERNVSAFKRAIAATVPDGTDANDAVAYKAAAEAVIANHIESNPTGVTPDAVPTLLASLAERYGFAQSTKPAAPARPKLAVLKRDAQPTATGTRQVAQLAATAANGVPTIPSMSPSRFQEKARAKQAARNVAPQGAGAQPVRRPGPPDTATVEEASKWYRTHGAA